MEAYSNILKYNSSFFEWLKSLPIKEGEEMQVIILPVKKNKKIKKLQSLKGTVKSYSEPFSSAVDNESWDALK